MVHAQQNGALTQGAVALEPTVRSLRAADAGKSRWFGSADRRAPAMDAFWMETVLRLRCNPAAFVCRGHTRNHGNSQRMSTIGFRGYGSRAGSASSGTVRLLLLKWSFGLFGSFGDLATQHFQRSFGFLSGALGGFPCLFECFPRVLIFRFDE